LEAREEASKRQKMTDELEEQRMKLEVCLTSILTMKVERLREEGMRMMREREKSMGNVILSHLRRKTKIYH
jgi:hypothetical protein